MQRISSEFAAVKRPSDAGFKSATLNNAIASLPSISDDVIHFLEKINPEAAKNDDKYSFFRDQEETEDITEHKFVGEDVSLCITEGLGFLADGDRASRASNMNWTLTEP